MKIGSHDGNDRRQPLYVCISGDEMFPDGPILIDAVTVATMNSACVDHSSTMVVVPHDAKRMCILAVVGEGLCPVRDPIVMYDEKEAVAERVRICTSEYAQEHMIDVFIHYIDL